MKTYEFAAQTDDLRFSTGAKTSMFLYVFNWSSHFKTLLNRKMVIDRTNLCGLSYYGESPAEVSKLMLPVPILMSILEYRRIISFPFCFCCWAEF